MKLNANPIYRTLDWLWRLIIKAGKDRCEICGSKDVLECHHIITRGDYWLRWEPKNGVIACRKCHKRPAKILAWLEEKDPKRYWWLIEQRAKTHPGQRIDLEAIERNLNNVL